MCFFLLKALSFLLLSESFIYLIIAFKIELSCLHLILNLGCPLSTLHHQVKNYPPLLKRGHQMLMLLPLQASQGLAHRCTTLQQYSQQGTSCCNNVCTD